MQLLAGLPDEKHIDKQAPIPIGVQEDVTDTEEVGSQHEVATRTSSTDGSVSASTSTVYKRRQRKTSSVTGTPESLTNDHEKTLIVETEKALTDGARFTASYAVDIFKNAFEKMRRPFTWILILYMVAWLAWGITPTLRTALSPLCIIPAISSSSLCVPITPPPSVNFEKLVHLQGETFDKLVGEKTGGSQLSMGVLKAEMAMRDLSIAVRLSSIKSKDSIADLLDTISADAKRTGRGLTRLDARVVGAIDEMMVLNNYAKVTIGDAHKWVPSPLLQAVSPFKLGPTIEDIITEAFVTAMDQSTRVIKNLILEAEVSLQNLEQLDVDIAVLYEMVLRADKYTRAERNELLQMWTKWDSERTIEDIDDDLGLLKDLEEYRKQAAARVKATLRELNTMSDDLGVLRDSVAAPGLLENKVPVQVHIANIQNGLERLQEGRTASWEKRITYDEIVKMLMDDRTE